MKINNKCAVITIASVAGIASIGAFAGIISRALKRNLINDLNNTGFGKFGGYGNCSQNCCSGDSYDEVLRHRKNRYYQRARAY